MLIRFFRWLFGYVRFTCTGGFTEGFINGCRNAGINLKNIRQTDGGITAETRIAPYKSLHRIAFANGCVVKIKKRRGLPFLLAPVSRRGGLLAGVVYMAVFISLMGGFIWNITVTGNDRITDVKIVDYLAQNGFKTGVRWNSVDKEQLEISVMSDFEEVAWISINKTGSTASVEISETVDKPKMEENVITNVTAAEDGVITRVIALGGWPEVKAGDAVTAGDLLISGVRESEVDKKNHYAHAHGTVLAQVSGDISLHVARSQTEKTPTHIEKYKKLFLFGLEIPLYLKKERGSADMTSEKTTLVINGYRLPLGMITETAEYYSESTRMLTDGELETLAKSELEKKKSEQLKNCEILNENITVEKDDSGCVITDSYSCIRDIAVQTEILFDTQ